MSEISHEDIMHAIGRLEGKMDHVVTASAQHDVRV